MGAIRQRIVNLVAPTSAKESDCSSPTRASRADSIEQEYRIEHDTMGEVRVPKDALWAAQTQRSVQNFVIGNRQPEEMIRAFGIQKAACADCNRPFIGDLRADAIIKAANLVRDGELMDQFPLVIYQTGSGTQTNMNVNEVVAAVANIILETEQSAEVARLNKVHPNDHVNYGMSTNDSYPTVMHIAAAKQINEQLIPALKKMEAALEKQSEKYMDVVKIGRTHLQDATPITVGQEFSGWATQMKYSVVRLESVLTRVYHLAQGGTAVGTGLNQVEGFDVEFCKKVSVATGLPFVPAENKFEAMASKDAMTELAGVQNTIATSFMKIANDIRLLGSGPTGGLAELVLPSNEPGSSIMPGKVNPTQPEAMSMVAAQVMGNSHAVSVSNSHGHLDLNVFMPVIAYNIIESSRLMTQTAHSMTDHCIVGIEPNYPKIAEHLAKNLMLVTALNSKIGYENAAKVSKTALQDHKTLKQVAVFDFKFLTEAEFDAAIVPKDMVSPKKRKIAA